MNMHEMGNIFSSRLRAIEKAHALVDDSVQSNASKDNNEEIIKHFEQKVPVKDKATEKVHNDYESADAGKVSNR